MHRRVVGAHPFGGFNMSGTDSKAGGRDYLLLFMQAKLTAKKVCTDGRRCLRARSLGPKFALANEGRSDNAMRHLRP